MELLHSRTRRRRLCGDRRSAEFDRIFGPALSRMGRRGGGPQMGRPRGPRIRSPARLPPRNAIHMTRVALLATGRSTFVQEAGRSVHRRALQLLRELGAEVSGPDHLIEDPEAVGSAGFTTAADARVLRSATLADASAPLAAFGGSRRPVVLWAVRDPAPT